jgi:succinate dehydrogenase / fumarate reductase, iron-sulfur subunit
MRLRRRAGDDHGINDRNNGHRHEKAFVSLVRDNGLLWEAELLPRSYGGDSFFGKFAPPAALELVDSLPVITKALLRRKVTPMGALKPHRLATDDRRQLKRLYDTIEGRDERVELNLYISGVDEDEPAAESEGMPSAPGGDPHGSEA